MLSHNENEAEAAGGHEHPAWQAHHFYSGAQQKASVKLGMWAFLVQEVLFFSGLFMAYFAFRYLYPDTWLAAHELLDWRLGGLNTVVLLFSSLTMALAVRACQLDDMKAVVRYLWITIGCAGIFMVVKYFEYSHKFHAGTLPGKWYTFDGIEGGAPEVFFAVYFMMTGVHGLHVVIGIGIMLWMIFGPIRKGKISKDYYPLVENVGLYWHLVDLIWIFLFPLLYLVR
ncbi:MAG: cytochrome c oxidase subunit 3 family protein [Alphaproteobacteria bacterium]|nr:cytochrome c oxidase subunit 3 family protein [Alphaproteobacteria bacterium]